MDIKNHEVDQSVCFDIEKSQDTEALNHDLVRGRDRLSSRVQQETSTQKPLRRKRRQLTGW